MNPWETPAGERARRTMFRLLAAQDNGAASDFAKDVLAGHRAPRDVLKEGWVLEESMNDIEAQLDRFSRLPESERTMSLDEAMASINEQIAEINALDVDALEAQLRPEPAPPAVEEQERGPFLNDAW
jgi:hypothetical protein